MVAIAGGRVFKRRPCLDASLAAVAGFAVLSWAPAVEAACTHAPPVHVANIDHTFPSGSRWVMTVERRECEGLTFRDVSYAKKGGTLQKVLRSATIAQIHVPYLNNEARFLDTTTATPGLGHIMSPAPAPGTSFNGGVVKLLKEECAGQTADGDRVCIIKDEEHDYGWKHGISSAATRSWRVRRSVVVFMSSQLGRYNYINKWSFHDDGGIEPELGLTGQLQILGTSAAALDFGSRLNAESEATPRVGISHMHNIYYRLDFDLFGSSNDAVDLIRFERFTDPSVSGCTVDGQCAKNLRTPLTVEAAEEIKPGEYTALFVYDKAALNSDGRPRGYELMPSFGGLWRGMAPGEAWAQHDFWVTREKPCEVFASANETPALPSTCTSQPVSLDGMVDSESIDGQNVVVWYAARLLHVPRDEDEPFMPTEWMSFHIHPRNFYSTNPTSEPEPVPTDAWKVNFAYAVGDVVTFQGLRYKCLQAHTSQVDWQPPNVPALWQRI